MLPLENQAKFNLCGWCVVRVESQGRAALRHKRTISTAPFLYESEDVTPDATCWLQRIGCSALAAVL